MKRSISFLFVIAALALAVPTFAQQVAGPFDLPVTATVIENCTVTTTAVDFGNYDPIVANATTPAGDKSEATAGTITVTCTKGSNGLRVDLNNGTADPNPRRMTGPGADILNYDLYQEATHATRWGTGAANGVALGVFSAANPSYALSVYGILPGGQNVVTGAYSDTVQVTVNR